MAVVSGRFGLAVLTSTATHLEVTYWSISGDFTSRIHCTVPPLTMQPLCNDDIYTGVSLDCMELFRMDFEF